MAGTPGYQAPEQLKAESVGVYSDVYAFGCIILVLYSGIPIWPGLTPFQIMSKVTIGQEKPDTSILCPCIKSISDNCLSLVSQRPNIFSVLQSLISLC